MTDTNETTGSDDEGLEAGQDEIDEEPGAGLGPGAENGDVEPAETDDESDEDDAE